MEKLQKDPFPWLPRTSTRRHTYKGEHLHFMKNEDLLRKYNNKLSTITMRKKINNKFLSSNQSELIHDYDSENMNYDKTSEIIEEEIEEKISLDDWEVIEKEERIKSYFLEAREWVMKCIYE